MSEKPCQVDSEQSELLRLCEKLADLMLAGRTDEAEKIIQENPEHATELRSVLPAIKIIHDVKSSDDSGRDRSELLAGSPLPHEGRLGDFQILREIGRGGMGVVYEAEQLLLRRRVALKVLPLAGLLDERQRVRFQNEARAAATLNHPGIVPIYFVGVERGIHFYAMQYITGRSLASVLQTLRGSTDGTEVCPDASTAVDIQAELSTQREGNRRADYFRSIARIGIDVAEALQHAHDHGIVHRDVKPSNLMLDDSGRCVVTDFGLARLEGDSQLTMTGDLIGTLRYAAPEQLLREPCQVDHRTDIFSLGATLYELLSLHPARPGNTREKLLQHAMESEPRRLRKYDATIPVDLQTIVHTAMARESGDRYTSAHAMAEDLRRYVNAQPIVSRRESVSQRVTRWAKRRPRLVLSSVAILSLFVVLLSFSLLAINRERAETTQQRDAAIANLMLALDALDEAHLEFGSQWIDRDQDLSYMQAGYLQHSADLFGKIAQRIPDDPRYFDEAGLAYQHAAKAAARLHEFSKADRFYQRACQLLAEAVERDPDHLRLRQSLSKAAYDRSQMLIAQWRLSQARESLQLAADQGRRIMQYPPRDMSMMLGMVQIEVAQLMLLELQQDEEPLLRASDTLHRRLELLTQTYPRNSQLHHSNLRLACIVARTLREWKRPEEAIARLDGALEVAKNLLHDFQDERNTVRIQAATLAERGRCELAMKAYDAAETSLRESLKQLRESFLFDGTPKEFSEGYRRGQVDHSKLEPNAYAQYAKTQASLAEVLQATNRHELAFANADEATRSCFMLAMLFPDVPDFIADAAECALVLNNFRQDGSGEASEAIQAKVRESVEKLRNRDELPPKYQALFDRCEDELPH